MDTKLNAQDRCDRCGAAALVRVDMKGLPLLFCGHHFNKNAEALEAAGATILENNSEWDLPAPALV